MGTMDNIIRTYVLQSDAKLHPLLAFVSVLGGLQVWGVFIGPIVASCLHALIQIFNTELKAFSQEKFQSQGLLETLAEVQTTGATDEKPAETSSSESPEEAPKEAEKAESNPASEPVKTSPQKKKKRRR